jgi:ParB family transcriptional regulator, chromosome partitioning protein
MAPNRHTELNPVIDIRPEHRPRLGRGLAALLNSAAGDTGQQEAQRGVVKSTIDLLRPNPNNPRRTFNDADLEGLAASIKERGVLQPVLVRAVTDQGGTYEIIAGERRWRAAQRAGQHEIPIIVIEAGDRDALEIAIVENVQRTDLNPLEEAGGYAQLVANYNYSHADIARIVGRSRSHVANTLRLTNLPRHSQSLLAEGKISAGHARALLSLSEPDAVADRIIAQDLTVRDVERLAHNSTTRTSNPRRARAQTADTIALQDRLALALGTTVTILHAGDNGEIRIIFTDLHQLDDLCRRLMTPQGDS